MTRRLRRERSIALLTPISSCGDTSDRTAQCHSGAIARCGVIPRRTIVRFKERSEGMASDLMLAVLAMVKRNDAWLMAADCADGTARSAHIVRCAAS
jgi:hypothetical protein